METGTIREKVELYINNGGSLRELSRRSGVPRSTLHKWFKGGLESEEIERRLEEYFASGGEVFIETRVAKVVWNLVEKCEEERELGVVIGRAGLGKTKAIREWVRAHSERAVLVTVTVTHTGRELLVDIGEKLGIYPNGNTRRILVEIANVLRDEGKVLIVDEADLLNERSLEILRAVYDSAEIGMVLSGMERLYVKMTKGTMMRDLAQLYSRVGYKVFLKLWEEDVKQVMDVYDVKGELFDLLWKVGQKSGMRGIIKAIRRAKRVAALNKRPVDREVMEVVIRELLMGVER